MIKAKKRPDKIVILASSLAAILIISVLGFQVSSELSGAGTGLMIFAGSAMMAPILLSVILFSFLVLKIRT